MKDIENEEYETDGDDQSEDDRVSPLPKIHSLHKTVDDWETIWELCQGVQRSNEHYKIFTDYHVYSVNIQDKQKMYKEEIIYR